ncbi:uncharacterized protein SAPINGB_P003973 [Magnusiomyces paraingens]|uniref:Major facilitator superfamily (MFS) profile domain-containing protein n=1 Tax=Magnusiomyces paraingens TaxID=2606893 RepID=A0A5E8BS57_9ASCO|nr:uncharacterized protein SAPINGB_P003973 [Saprochaete ingens]VVT54233.1 unnamed protein product [Saprochaete ingens]
MSNSDIQTQETYGDKPANEKISDSSSDNSNEIYIPENDDIPLSLTEKPQPFHNPKEKEEDEEDHHHAHQHNPDEPVPLESLDWDSPDDPENPQNWSNLKKWVITMTAAFMCLSVTCGSSLFVSGTFDMMVKFHASQTLVLSGLTFYLIGLSLGPVLGAPLSEIFGRKIVYLTSMPISMLFVMGVGLSTNIWSVLILRFFSGFFASPVMAIAGGTISDLWSIEMLGVTMTAFCFAPFAGPVLGPIMGGFAVAAKGWKWTMWISLMLSGVTIPFIIWMPETYKRTIMRRRAKKRGITIQKPKMGLGGFLKLILVLTVLRPLQMLFAREPIVIVLSIYSAFVFAILFGFFEAYPVIYTGVYDMSHSITGLTFIGIGVGLCLGVVVFLSIDRFIFYPTQPDGTRIPKGEDGKPIIPTAESRLLPAKIGAILLPISLFWQAWTARASVHWMAPLAAGVPFGMSLLLIFFSVLLYFMLSYPTIILASALAANNLARYIIASVFPLFTVQMYKRMHISWASSFFAFVALAMMPIPWLFEIYGPRLRAGSYFNRLIAEEERQRKEREEAGEEEDEEDTLSLALARTMSRSESMV